MGKSKDKKKRIKKLKPIEALVQKYVEENREKVLQDPHIRKMFKIKKDEEQNNESK